MERAAAGVPGAVADRSRVLALARRARVAFRVAQRAARAAPFAWLSAAAWAPGAATLVIGVAFGSMLLLVGDSWAYTDVLAELARGAAMNLPWRAVLLLALFAGALAGGYSAGKWRTGRVQIALCARCCAGGFLMGVGSLLIPGSNDGLVLLGLPLLWPHAWLAFAIMCATVGAALLLERRALIKNNL